MIVQTSFIVLKLAENEQQRAGRKPLGMHKVGKAKCVRVYLCCEVEEGNLFDNKKREKHHLKYCKKYAAAAAAAAPAGATRGLAASAPAPHMA